MTKQSNPYKFTVKGVTFDFYDLSDAINFKQSAVEHAAKKLVALGERSGKKPYLQDLDEAIQSLYRAREQYIESLRSGTGTVGAGTSTEETPTQGALLLDYEGGGDSTLEVPDPEASEGTGSNDESLERALEAIARWKKTLQS